MSPVCFTGTRTSDQVRVSDAIKRKKTYLSLGFLTVDVDTFQIYQQAAIITIITASTIGRCAGRMRLDARAIEQLSARAQGAGL
jgi:hypothetical protein